MTLPHAITLARRAQWRRADALHRRRIPAHLRPWIMTADSLTAQIRALCPDRFRLTVLRQARARPMPDEARVLGMARGSPALLREVALSCGETPLVLARTVIPAASLHGRCERLLGLGHRPLGAVLFADRSTRRSALAVSPIVLPRAGLAGAAGSAWPIWGRRAVFHFGGSPLLVCEFFLPALTELAGRCAVLTTRTLQSDCAPGRSDIE